MERPQRLADVDWSRWQPTHRATLVFIVRGDELLLIHKKRGLGAGKISAPGGRLEPGETLADCAVREVREELCVTPLAPRWCGENRFQFSDGYAIEVHVYRSDALLGVPTETEEAVPLWVKRDAIPYAEMWQDDEVWLPHLLEGGRFTGRYVFDGDRMLDYVLDLLGDGEPG